MFWNSLITSATARKYSLKSYWTKNSIMYSANHILIEFSLFPNFSNDVIRVYYIPFICVTFFPLFLFLIWNPICHYWLNERSNYILLNESQNGLVGEKPRCDLCLAQRYYNSINCVLCNIYDTWSEKIKLFRTLMKEIMIIDNIMWVERASEQTVDAWNGTKQ